MSIELKSPLAVRVESAETSTLFSRLSALRDLENNALQVHMESFGRTKAFIVKGIPDPYFNSVRGLTDEDLGQLDQIIEFYRDHGMPCRFHIAPFAGSEVMLSLAKRGYYQSGFHTSLCGWPERELPIPQIDDGITIRKIGDSEFSLYGEIYTKAFNMPSFLAPDVSKNNQILNDKPGWQFYLASYHNTPAAIAVLYVQGGVGSLAAAATLPEYRGRGCHTALLASRIQEAAKLNCILVVGQAKFGSVSHGNMERLGLQVAYTKSIWGEIPK